MTDNDIVSDSVLLISVGFDGGYNSLNNPLPLQLSLLLFEIPCHKSIPFLIAQKNFPLLRYLSNSLFLTALEVQVPALNVGFFYDLHPVNRHEHVGSHNQDAGL
ncbi:hypothetical protein AC245_00055 [Haemophilus parainfluenzae]|jgi:putative uncharacterized protein (fragment)|nr:hypothetical protein AC245_00055 [Haemophilus parainfluenzae]